MASACTSHHATPPTSAPTTYVSPSTPSALPSKATPRGTGSPLPPLVPSYPPGTTTCGSYDINATTRSGTKPLLSCAGLAGMSAANRTHLSINVGEQILISGLGPRGFLVAPGGVLEVHGSLLVGREPGTATVVAHNVACLPSPEGTQPDSCPLLDVAVSAGPTPQTTATRNR